MSGRPYILAEATWSVTRQTPYQVAVLPWGAIEAHNLHLPYATDVVESEAIAAEAARLAWEQGARVIVLPCVPYGVNTGQIDVKLDININPSTQLAILQDIAEVLEHQGIPKLVILNGHGGNDFRQMVREMWPRYDLFLCVLNWYDIGEDGIFVEKGDHAGEMETSLMLHVRPDWVLPLEQAGEGRTHRFRIRALREGWAWTQRDWTRATVDTGVGNPQAATPAKGEEYLRHLAARISSFLVELAAADLDDLYETD
ncbi:MAG: creatininase family protein [Candidatus Latescibacterota bacterium]